MKLGIDLDEDGLVKTDKYNRTSIEGIYAVGNAASKIDLLIVAAAQGATVAHDAYRNLRKASSATYVDACYRDVETY